MSTPNEGTTPGSSSVPLPWGKGLSRASGSINQDPTLFADLRNLIFLTGSIRLRGGVGAPVESITDVDHVCYLATFRETAQSIAVGYNQTTGLVSVWAGTLLGTGWTKVGDWGTLNSAADAPPQFTIAETFGILLLAHDEANVTHRLPTFVYDPSLSGPLLSHPALQAGASDPKKIKWITFDYDIGGTHTAASAEQAISGLTVTATLWGAMLVQIDAAGTVTTKVASGTEAYNTENEALLALPAPDASHIEVGHITVNAGASNWVAGTNNLTTDPAFVNFYDGAHAPWCELFANLDNTFLAAVKFRGVQEYLGYIWGWGFGANSDPDRPEIIRVSDADDPTVYEANWYIKVGARAEAIVAAAPVMSAFAVLKSGSWHRIDGTSRDDWGPTLVDGAVGCVSARARVTVDGKLYWWSPQGPRSTDGTVTMDGGLDLDLTGDNPNDLPTVGPLGRCFALYYPNDRRCGFYIPNLALDATLGYMVSMRQDGGGERWNYEVLGVPILHGAVIEADQSSIIPPGYATAVTTTGSAGSGVGSITVDWTDNAAVGDEIIELWYQHGADPWQKLKEFAYSTINPAAPETTFSGPLILSGAYNVQIRYRRSGRYYTGYSSTNPDDWPAGSLASGTVVIIPPPTGVTVVYDYVTGNITVSWTAGDPTMAQDVEIGAVNLGVTDDASVVAGTFTKVFPNGLVSGAARGAGESVSAKVRHKVGAIVGAYVAAPNAAAYWTGSDITGLTVSITGQRESVSLGTDFDVRFTRPPLAVGNWQFELDGGANLGAYPANGGCGASFPAGGGYFFPSSTGVVVPLFVQTYPDTEPSPITATHVPAFACATCTIVGQVVGMGSYAAIWTFAKTGTLVHRTSNGVTAFKGFLPGSSIGFSPGVVCNP